MQKSDMIVLTCKYGPLMKRTPESVLVAWDANKCPNCGHALSSSEAHSAL